MEEVNSVHEALSEYAEQVGIYVFNPTQPFPELDTSKLAAEELLVYARNNKDSAVDAVAGAMTATVYKTLGIARELTQRSMTKAMMYDFAINEASQTVEEARAEGGKKTAEIRSMTPGQIDGV